MQIGDRYTTEDGVVMEVVEVRDDEGGGRTIISRPAES